jgi:hypothetical protein
MQREQRKTDASGDQCCDWQTRQSVVVQLIGATQLPSFPGGNEHACPTLEQEVGISS